MSKITLNPVNYYDLADIYSVEVDNRPLRDLAGNIDLLNTAISQIGTYQEVYANPETEPAGGFSPLTCVLYGQNGFIFPIDIAQPITTIDYSKYPIFLVLEKLDTSLYKCLSFSAALALPGLFNKFLPDSIGRAIKVGPGGSLVDEIYFDLYYSDYSYQNIIVGKVLTPTIISFGGNQVSVLGDNRFLAKNRDDSTTGLVTRVIQNDVNSTAFKSTLVNSELSAYPFTEYINQLAQSSVASQPSRVPVYFSSLPLKTTGGIFNVEQLESLLNEVHFASPSVSADTHTDQKYKTAGINVGSLIEYSQAFLLHAKPLSNNLNELSQQLSTSLYFDTEVDKGLTASFDTTAFDFPLSASTLVSGLLSGGTSATGVELGQFKTAANGSILFHATNTIDSSTVFTDDPTTFPISSLKQGTALVLYNRGTSGSAALVLGADGPVILDSPTGVICNNPGEYDSSLATRGYVTKLAEATANTALTKIPLIGSSQDVPVTGSLYFDVKGNAEPSVVLQFDSLLSADIKSAYPVVFKALATSDYQTVRGATPATGDANDLTNRSFVQAKIDAAVSNAIGTNFVSRTAADTIEANKTFGEGAKIITQALNPIELGVPSDQTTVTITSAAEVIDIAPLAGTVKVQTSATVNADPDTTLVTKGYMLNKVEEIAAGKVGEMIYGIWNMGPVTTHTNQPEYNNWAFATRGMTPDQQSSNFSTYFAIVENGGLQYLGDDPAVFTVHVSDGRFSARGPALPGTIFRTQTAIAVKSSGRLTTVTKNIHQDDTHSDSKHSLVGSSCSSIVVLNKNDILYTLSEQAESVSTSLARIR